MEIEFNNSNLKSTILGVNVIESLKRYKIASEGGVRFWLKEKENNKPDSDENIKFFN